MPNHCENDLYISGKKEDVDALLEFVGMNREKPTIDFNVILPYPKEYEERDRDAEDPNVTAEMFTAKYGPNSVSHGFKVDGYNVGGHAWTRKAWGTKWNAYEVVRRDYEVVCITFQTAWSPPIPVIQELHRKFPKTSLSLEYFEYGGGFAGGFTCCDEDDWFEEAGEWEAGKMSQVWETDNYRGRRGG